MTYVDDKLIVLNKASVFSFAFILPHPKSSVILPLIVPTLYVRRLYYEVCVRRWRSGVSAPQTHARHEDP